MRSTDNAVLDHTRDRSFRGKPELRLHYLLLNYSNLQNPRLRSTGLTVPLQMKIALSLIDTQSLIVCAPDLSVRGVA